MDGITWLQDILKKENINREIKTLLPRIEAFSVADRIVDVNNAFTLFAKFKKILNSPKLLTIFNIDKTVTKIKFMLEGTPTFLNTKFNKLTSIQLHWNGLIKRSNNEFKDINIYKNKSDTNGKRKEIMKKY